MKEKNFMKSWLGRGDSGFARVLTILVLLLTMATGAWADELYEEFTTNQKLSTYNGTHFTITCTSKGDADGIIIHNNNSITITSKNGNETITHIELHMKYGHFDASSISSDPGTVVVGSGNVTNGDVSITGINATSVSFSSSSPTYSCVDNIKVYYVVHTHSFTYQASGATITATCAGTDANGVACTLENLTATLTIEGSNTGAKFTGDTQVFSPLPTVNYYMANGDDTRGAALDPITTAPTALGKYWAEFTLGDQTAHVVYNVVPCDLSELTDNYTAQNGGELTGTLVNNVKITIANGATVTLDGVTINGVNDAYYLWAGITCEGDATIILKDGTTNSVTGFHANYPGIYVPAGKTLTIKGETEGTGVLNVQGSVSTDSNHGGRTIAAGIGAGVGLACGDIVIEGGVINATGGWACAAIGGAWLTACGNITITGGTVNATGSLAAAGIGGGWVTSCGDIAITGGTINATGGDYINSDATGNDGGPAIGGSPCGSCGTITIGGTANVTVTKGLGAPYSIGQGGSWNNVAASCGTVTIFGVEGQISDSPYNATAPTSYNVTANSASGAYWATFYSNAGNYQAPEGTQVFTVNLEGTTLTMSEISDRIVKSGEGVVLKNSTTGSITMTKTGTAPAGDFSSNSLKGTMTKIETTGANDYYVLGGKNGAGFYKLSNTSGTIGATKAYLIYDGSTPAPARGYFLFDEATGIEMPTAEGNDFNGTVYDLQGRRVTNPTKGLYIVNGKKVFINK